MKRFGLIFLTAVFFSSVTFAEGVKIGIVDLQKIMQTSSDMKAIQEKLEKEFKPRRDVIVANETELKKNIDKFKRDNAVMSQTERKNLEKKIAESQQKFEKEGQQYQQELSTAHNKEMEQFYSKIRAAISKIAERDKYDVVLQKDAAPFSAERLDVTSKVLQEMNA